MTYRIRGLDPAQFADRFAMDGDALAATLSLRLTARPEGYYACRVSLQEAAPGEEVLLTNFTHHDPANPYRSAFAIYVRRDADEPAEFVDSLPPVLRRRPIALRGYTADGCLHRASLALADDVDAAIRALLEDPDIAYIDAHNAAHGCFAARVERYRGL
ncbi:MAG: DUF1203 domain-containing protein [Pseudomonadota bacterium]|nr:DUF1203 domain-containing protein [Pseudomonadota bacterium]